ncbi:bolA-like family protein [Burkholderia ambifaria AMMD]|uniref:Transcriptional regulator, BolA protein family n=1 Tax=Burkholderia ambifaria (strain ATCC BAA-244 / DSM 16087 / CCUG 44356 / LMG 19182 / AMMD) TaxID=339670 RepID=Q0BEG8_BURCM|nr:BolA family protein [Burkholderia ambifaria]ABI87455.1 transcriptional regulator, BolA protein family [Burkholderia ambifaria AMMD]AJY21352.1 bolA-like family protein [Burkholderia ambifaria AMMD]MBR7928946.1 BolA family transcriptional regulator [Burkholderia ambifaria]PEH65341.1 BolA family transcriptional regulator [Burkholderia ambifaria]QQC05334.1 BolA family transcriptional regulator [Burkholderia ambifaria]
MTDAFLDASPDERIALIEARLTASLAPLSLTVRDDSAQHAGHAGAAAGGHYTVTIVSAAFAGKPRVARHRLVYDALADAMQRGIHALAIVAYTPEEFNESSI